MKARKLLTTILALSLVLATPVALSGCGGGGNTLKVGVKSDVIGFGFKDPATGEFSGMEIDLAYLLADALGYDGVEFTAVTAATRTELLDSGDLDCVLATFTITEERKKNWDFSTPYFTDAVTVLVETASGIQNLNDLVGMTIGVSTGSTSAFALVSAMSAADLFPGYTVPASSADFTISTFNQQGTTFQEFGDYPAISNALAAGTVDAFCVDRSILYTYLSDTRSFINESFAPQQYGVATRQGSELSAPIEELIVKWLEDGTIDRLISENHLG